MLVSVSFMKYSYVQVFKYFGHRSPKEFLARKERGGRDSSPPVKIQFDLLAEMLWIVKDEPQHAWAHSLTAEEWEPLRGVNVDSKLESFG